MKQEMDEDPFDQMAEALHQSSNHNIHKMETRRNLRQETIRPQLFFKVLSKEIINPFTQTTSRNTDIFTTIVRNVSKADNIFIFFYSNFGYKGGSQEVLKPHNLLYHPLSWESGTSIAQRYYKNIDLSFQLSIGNTVIPEMPTMGVADNYKHLQETRNNHVSIKPHMYRTNSFLAGFNLKKLNSANYTGLNLKNNSNMVVRVKPLYGTDLYTTDNGTDTGLMPDKIYMLFLFLSFA